MSPATPSSRRARAFVEHGGKAVELFTPFGIPATIIAELNDLVHRYDEAEAADARLFATWSAPRNSETVPARTR